ncbi:hypothetical protein HY468_05265 [Candidatus Roizmanbacteria bacterium]|nr:hypothetical protein [Candidatus Roizmanbacteria bacterium]
MPDLERAKNPELEKEAPVSFEIFYGAHGSAKDIEGLSARLTDADIFIPELLAWTPIHRSVYRGISAGILTPKVAVQRFAAGRDQFTLSTDVVLKMFEMIYNTHKPIAFTDVPYGHPIARRQIQLNYSGFPINRNFYQTLQNAKNHIRDQAAVDLERENYIVSHLQPTVDQVLDENPLLKNKQNVRALLFHGTAHTRIHHALKRSGSEVEAHFCHKPYVYPFSAEAERRYMFGKEVDDELAARSFMELTVFFPGLQKFTRDFSKIQKYVRIALSKFTLHEIEANFNFQMKYGSQDLFLSQLAEKRIIVPQLEDDIDQFLELSEDA